jgi:hypothetical protein
LFDIWKISKEVENHPPWHQNRKAPMAGFGPVAIAEILMMDIAGLE